MSPQTTSSEISCNFGTAQARAVLLKFTELHHTPQILVCPEAFSYKEEKVEKMICAQLLDNSGGIFTGKAEFTRTVCAHENWGLIPWGLIPCKAVPVFMEWPIFGVCYF